MANLKVNSKENFASSQSGGGLGTRRSNGTQSQRRLPSIKRPIAASVSMQGWLHKQGSEGFMLWKKRWFVLSEYCLYYYKNSDEEKVLGSILLPSYKISPCTAIEGKLFRKKFSFKAEHANMRTYYFSADSREIMVQWMNAMSLASIAQDQSVGKNNSHKTNTLKPGVREKNLTVGFSIPNSWPRNVMNNGLPNGTHPGNSHHPNHHYHPSAGNNVENYAQPLYVNAPPKPRRIGEPSECTYDKAFPVSAAKVSAEVPQERPPARHHLPNRMLAHVESSLANYSDRRTPDAYGTSPCFDGRASSPSKVSNQLLISDYEELYNLASAYDQYDSSAASSRSTTNPVASALYRDASQQPPAKSSALINRPRSVDFLQSHDVGNSISSSRLATEQQRPNPQFGSSKCSRNGDRPSYVPPPRPKSSIEVVNSDGFHYSEEQYVENMRKSAQFLVAKTTPSALTKCMAENKLLQHSKVHSPSDGAASTDSESGAARKSNQFMVANHVVPRAAAVYKKCNTAYATTNGPVQNDFTRSKSARICREKQYVDGSEKSCDESSYKRKNSWHSKEHGDRSNQQVQQREESMKRLLEWKQRMLQSPLTRKSIGSGCRDDAKNELFKNKMKSNVDDSSYQISSASPVSSLSDKPQDSINESNGHEEAVRRSRDFPIKTTQLCDDYDRRIQTLGPPVRDAQAPYVHNNDLSSETISMYRATSSSAIREIAKPLVSSSSARTINLQTLNSSSNSFTGSPSSVVHSYGKTDNVSVKSNSSTKEIISNQDEAGKLTSQDLNDLNSRGTFKSSTNEPDHSARVSTRSYEFPPQNIVQSRIKVFEKSSDTRVEDQPQFSYSTLPTRESPLNLSRNLSTPSDICSVSTLEASNNDQVSNYRKEEKFSNSKMACPSARDLLLNLDWQIMPPNSPTHSKTFENDLHVPAEKPPLPPESNESKTSEKSDHDSSPEDHYLPMAPSKKTVFNGPNDLFYHTRSNSASSASQIMILETLLSEDVENSYVEMTVGEDRTMAKNLKKFSADCDSAENKCDSEKSHYEFLYKASSTPNEPLYMEVTTKEKSTKSESLQENGAAGANTNSALPDILNSSNPLRMLTDSSDADDEASKELDPLEVPQHPRFSLSDTFRPASYYLGGGLSDRNALGLSFDQPDSSDSDLVSPPSIPTSPPPLDDFSVPSIDMSLPLAQSSGMTSHAPLSPPMSPLSMCKDSRRSDFEDSCSSVIENILPSEAESFDSKISTLSSSKKFGLERCSFDLDSSVDSYVEHQMPDGALFETPASQYQHFQSNSHFSVESRPIVEVVPPCDDLAECEEEDESTTVASSVATSSTMNAPISSMLDHHLGAPYYYADLLKASDEDRLVQRKSELCLSNPNSKNILPNNQRENNFECANTYKRNDIGKKVNQIAEEERAVSRPVMDKNAICASTSAVPKYIEDKNIYSSDIFRNKFGKHGGDFRCTTPNETLNEAVNLYAQYSRSSHSVDGPESPSRRSRSLEGLLDKTRSIVAQRAVEVAEKMTNGGAMPMEQQPKETTPNGEHMVGDMWEEDSLWRETLRKTSLRHARSLDDLDKEDRAASKCGRQSADILSSTSPSETKKAAAAFKKITRDVTYVNDCVSAQMRKAKQNSKEYTEDYREIRKIKRYARTPTTEGYEEDTHYERLDPRATLASLGRRCEPTGPLENMKEHGKDNTQPKTGAQSFLEEGVYPTKPPSFEIDREKLRQWDLMSSAPVAMINAIQRYPDAETQPTDTNAMPAAPDSDSALPNSQVSGCDSVTGRSPLPFRNITPVGQSQVGLGTDNGYSDSATEELHSQNRLNDAFSRCLPGAETYMKGTIDNSWNLNVSAGELLGRTHEELVLLLIQLRRQSASICKEMESCHIEIETQEKLMETDKPKKMKHLNRVEELKKRITELERQYKKGKPLVNLVDNMVKLGSLYRTGPPNRYNQLMDYPLKAKLEFNDRMQEQRLLAEEREEWERVSPDHSQLQAKVKELYKMDRELQQESYLLQILKQDKDLLEYALSGLKCKIQSTQDNPSEMERYRRQQLHLEQDLSRVRSVLARNSKKLEETVMANGKLEAELVVLRQKLQLSQRPFQENAAAAPTVVALENELKRVQMLVGNLQRQRDELSIQVRQLTEKSKNLCREMRHCSPTVGLSPTLESAKKRGTSGWIETDLDNGTVQDFSLPVPYQNSRLPSVQSFDGVDGVKSDQCSPSVYAKNVSSTVSNFSSICYSVTADMSPSYCEQIDINESDDKMKRFYGILPREKPQEIKTVRIVKRESERRQRDRDRNNVGVPIASNSKRLNNTLNETVEEREITDTILTDDQKHSLSRQQSNMSGSLTSKIDVDSLRNSSSNPTDICSAPADYDDKVAEESGSVATKSNDKRESPQLTSLYRSKAAKEIVEELVLKVNRKGEPSRRVMSKEKRRHHTISHNKPILPLDGHNASLNTRSRDDLDMERALRPRLNGTPDVVRSTLCRTEDIAKYDAETIDYVIGTPEKILIPERYVPENSPELSPEEQDKRLRKAEAIRKMLSETGALSTAANGAEEDSKTLVFRNNLEEKKRQRDHILQLNQILAQQVMQKSKLVAEVGTSHLS